LRYTGQLGKRLGKLILKRAEFNFVILNIYPYISGRLMVVPYEPLADLDKSPKNITDEMRRNN
jgi:Diadenosine tetraphosphate (Ap4A) hydrolase and other HIT family hydrolases